MIAAPGATKDNEFDTPGGRNGYVVAPSVT